MDVNDSETDDRAARLAGTTGLEPLQQWMQQQFSMLRLQLRQDFREEIQQQQMQMQRPTSSPKGNHHPISPPNAPSAWSKTLPVSDLTEPDEFPVTPQQFPVQPQQMLSMPNTPDDVSMPPPLLPFDLPEPSPVLTLRPTEAKSKTTDELATTSRRTDTELLALRRAALQRKERRLESNPRAKRVQKFWRMLRNGMVAVGLKRHAPSSGSSPNHRSSEVQVIKPRGDSLMSRMSLEIEGPELYSTGRRTQREAEDEVVDEPPRIYRKSLLPGGGWRRFMAYVRGPDFDYLSGLAVVINAITMGAQTDWQARTLEDDTSPGFRGLEIFFCFFFTTELLLRLFAYGRAFLTPPDILWNLFDTTLVVMQVSEFILDITAAVIGQEAATKTQAASSFNIMRILRVLRLIRVMRLMRVLRLITELRALISSIAGSLKSLIWAVLLLFVMMYVVGVYLTQLVYDHRLGDPDQVETSEALVEHWGSLGDSINSLWKSVTGGIDWGDVVDPLSNDISIALVPLYMLYISFALLCMLNVITGVFVESALQTARTDKDVYLYNHFRSIFHHMDTDGNGELDIDEFRDVLLQPEVQDVFEQIDMDVEEAFKLFRLLDEKNKGTIELEQFVNGCSLLRVPAKALNVELLRKDLQELKAQSTGLESYLKRIAAMTATLSASAFGVGGAPGCMGDTLGASTRSPPATIDARSFAAVYLPAGAQFPGSTGPFEEDI
eukprot:CAMPEP_0206498142 /NCGR_PEP_ID=MMETSP0324_2-20121206/50750_1 /ASSEMBLY_ACC=CAM_ASM_000836 /TAXON_ID=2866 /ORGANISM="Crypthecodinium cohnii, Strain Seligo" /LENGTH=720 /DNA_ID=CAMNT_0053984137 /DNA_START=116 /DNA_END=2278 /DNA_ORIENTATION=-